ncbi:hypothetical protein OC842_001849 [Tilletia horrida]|uniref:Major facilitator superfamily (MFS) profile domain-containing protein n=1 Tax=Tilletia horrida TaxID=155126 RepID=A0AAN6GEB1_9BASI|nr:hypothetical protein OC842_001849 [Tilletia horrida]
MSSASDPRPDHSSTTAARRQSASTTDTLLSNADSNPVDRDLGTAPTNEASPSSERKASVSTVDEKVSGGASKVAAETDVKTTVAGKHVFNEQTNYALPWTKIVAVFFAVSVVAMTALLDQTILATALTTIGKDLQAGSQVTWISNAFFLTSTSFQLLYGKLSDIVGRKLCLLTCLAVFFIGSLASSLAQDIIQLSIFRAISGIGGGGLMTLAQVIISDVVSLRERGKYQGILGAVIAVSNGVGPIIGGLIASRSSWRNIFRLQLGLIPVAASLVIFIMPLKKVQGSWKKKAAAIDYLGAILTLASAALMVLGLNWAGGIHPWDSPAVLVPLLIGIALSVVFVLYQWKGAQNPLMPLDIFKSTLVAGGSFTMFVNGFIFVVQVYNVVQMYQIVYGYSPIRAGLVFLPLVVMQTLSSTVAGICVSRLGRYREILMLGWAIWSIGMGLFATLGIKPDLGKQLGFGVLAGFGVGGTLQSAVPRNKMAVLTASRNYIRNLGAALGLAIAQTTIQSTIRAQLRWRDDLIQQALNDPSTLSPVQLADFRAAYLLGFCRLFYVLASLAVASFWAVFFFVPQRSIDRADDEDLKKGRTPEELAQESQAAAAAAAASASGKPSADAVAQKA